MKLSLKAWLDRDVTTTQSVVVEYGYWCKLAMAEVQAKLLTERERKVMRALARRLIYDTL